MNKKSVKRKLVLAMAGVMCIANLGLTACGGREAVEELEADKSLLNVAVFNSGIGDTWIKETIKDFEKAYADTSFEDGKKGVQVILDSKKDEFKPATLKATMPGYDNALYFLEYYDFDAFSSEGLLEDMTDAVTEKVYDAEGNIAKFTGKEATQSILDTMYDEYEGKFMKDGKNYGIPYTLYIGGMMYDADLFDSERLYISADGHFSQSYEDVSNGDCGPGPDGELGTVDDGMPETWPEFVELMATMKKKGITPFTWSGQTSYQVQYAFNSIWANYEGYDNYMLNNTLSGKHSTLGQVTEANSTKVLAEQQGRKAGIKAFYDIVKGGYQSSNSLIQSFTEAQTTYVMSKTTNAPVAMFMEGGYWEQEARDTFDRMAIANPEDGYGKRNFKLLPIPNFVGVEGIQDQSNTTEKEVICGYGDGMVMLAKQNTCENPELQLKLAKLFLQFSNSREQLAKFVKNTGACIRPYNMTMSDEEKQLLTKFGQSVYAYMEEGSKMLPDIDISKQRQKYATLYDDYWNFAIAKDKNTIIRDVPNAFNTFPSMTVDECFKLLKTRIKKLDNELK